MKTIDVSTKKRPNTFALVDDDDFADLSQHRWYVNKLGYVIRTIARGEGGGIEYMHRRVMGNPPNLVDHENRNTLDNQRGNLRHASKQGNAANSPAKSRCGLKGVNFHPATGKWRARIMVDGKQISLGVYKTPEEAHAAYVVAAKQYFGEFARAA